MTTTLLDAVRLAQLLGQPAPTDEQRAVIEAPTVPMLVVAGAGSGKTETMAARVVWLIANGIVEPREVLGLTFTRKAAHELSERIATRLGTLATALQAEGLPLPPGLAAGTDDLVGQRPAVRTYNGFALDLVLENALAVGVDPRVTMMSPSASWQHAYEIVESSGDELGIDASPATLTAALVSLTGALADHLLTPAELETELRAIRDHLEGIPLQHEGRRRATPQKVRDAVAALDARIALVPLLERFARERRERARLDFSDQVTLAAQVARTVPGARDLARSMHRVVLLDEFQDTSVAQLQMLAALFGAGHPVIAVGDPQQAIYGWRGASAASLAGFAREFAPPGGEVLQRTLSISWRNDEAPLRAANRVAAPLRADGGGVTIPQLRARPGAGPGALWMIEAADEQREAEEVARWILGRRAEDPDATAAVLVRSRRQIPAVVEGLEGAGLPVEVVGLGGLLHRPEVGDVRAVLDLLHDPTRGDALMRLLTGPGVRLGARDLAVLGRWRDRRARPAGGSAPVVPDTAAEVSLVDALDDLPPRGWTDPEGRDLGTEGRRRLEELRDLLRSLRRSLALPLPDLITDVVRALALDTELLAAGRDLSALEALRRHADDFERSAEHPDLGAYLALLDIAEETERALPAPPPPHAADPHAVTVLTMHAAKGLEWDLVAVVGLTEGSVPSYDLRSAVTLDDGRVQVRAAGWLGKLAEATVPSSLRGDADILPQLAWAQADTQVEALDVLEDYRAAAGEESLREDRRLVYVAMTRARRELLLSSAAWRGDAAHPRERSRYLREAAPDVPGERHLIQPVPEENPLVTAPRRAVWPPAPGPAEEARRRAEDQVARAAAEAAGPEQLSQAARRVLADLEERRAAAVVSAPVRLSASQLVARAQDPQRAALDLLRPLPRRPSASARRGTRFHAWLEQSLSGQALLDLDEIEDLADEDDLAAADLDALQESFAASPWAGLTPIAVEQPVLMRLGEHSVRGVIDAVYPDPEAPARDADTSGGHPRVVIVDWKTGRPSTGERRRARALQLTVYRLAWHERTGIPLSHIRTVFHHVAENITDEVTEHPSRQELERLLGEGD
ncbi:ATP-dependent helicase [Brachybacterium sp. EF45031]|uniref:ATP-dependent DNA helicase n=1 Tax=Brachybacterium sillae TaxID=2810536 RepID=UPI00217D109A|nr:ATP-dependent DNA helicase [Brachybacterium sillae]MCS6712452.1 ATP-dependent helicase [Brachybacterium sillae]